MAKDELGNLMECLRRVVLAGDRSERTDGQLLEDYLNRRDEAAVRALVQRHGPMVWGVCRRVLRNHHDAEDAFQATFLVLVRKAASVQPREAVANWLHGVAHQTALKARATAAKRQARERQVREMPEPGAVQEPDLWRDLEPLLDRELSRLPDRYRVAVVLCDLEGNTRKEAARRLGIPEGTLSTRLRTARTMLAKRLARHGLGISGGALAAVVSRQAASACVPPLLASSTIRAAGLFAAGQAAAAGVISFQAAALTEGVLKTMLLARLKAAVAVVLVLGFLGTGVTALTCRTAAAQGGGPTAGGGSLVVKGDKGGDKPVPPAAPKLVPAGVPKQEDKKPAWDLDFRYKEPRLATLRIPGKGGKVVTVWYLWYQVVNNTRQPHTFIPAIEVVSGRKVYHDEVRAGLTEAIRRIEDPTNATGLENSVTVARKPIPPSKSVAALATWGCADPDAADAKSFTVYVAGLSSERRVNGDSVWRKVLKLRFRRVGKEMTSAGPAEWVYRPYRVNRAAGDGADRAKPLGHIVRVTRQGDRVYISLGRADNVHPKMTFSVYAAGSHRGDHGPKGSLEVVTVLGPHLSLAEVEWVRDPDGKPLVQGDELYGPAPEPTEGPDRPAGSRPPRVGLYDGDRDVEELIHRYRGLSDRDKLGPEGERIRLRLGTLSQADQVHLSPITRDAIAAVEAEHLLRGDLRTAKARLINDAVNDEIKKHRLQTYERLLQDAARARETPGQKNRAKLLRQLERVDAERARLLRDLRGEGPGTSKKRLTLTRDRLPARAETLAPLLRQMARDRYHDGGFTVHTTASGTSLTLEGPSEIVGWAKKVLEALNEAARTP